MSERRAASTSRPALQVQGLHVYYGRSHAIQGVDLQLPRGVLSVVGRNGMGKTTLCNAIMGLQPSSAGSIRVNGREIRGRTPNVIARFGVGYVPQGRRIWPSLSVDEHLRLCQRGGEEAAWTVDRIYGLFPRLAERRTNGGAQLSGGEQQMLAIGRALLGNPDLLVMDEPTEGLAPVIVAQVEAMLVELAREDALSVLVIEQNIGVATEVSEQVAVMVNGRITRILPSAQLAADPVLQQRLLGVGRHAHDETDETDTADDAGGAAAPGAEGTPASETPRFFQVARRNGTGEPMPDVGAVPTRFGNLGGIATRNEPPRPEASPSALSAFAAAAPSPFVRGEVALVVGTFDTKSRELEFLRDRLREQGHRVRTVDVSTSGRRSRADVQAVEVAASATGGSSSVFTGDRGRAVTAMAQAFERWITTQRDVGGVISAGGSGGTALVTPGMRTLPVGVPKLMVSTVASGDVSPYVGAADIMMLHSVADIAGINAISEPVLRNAAGAFAGMLAQASARRDTAADAALPALGVTMFGVTTPCVQAFCARLEERYDCVVFHATGIGGRCMEKLVDSQMLRAVADVTTTEIADHLVGGVFAATEDRMGAIARTGLPYVGSVGALDMVNFGAMDTVPEQFRSRRLHVHNPQVTLMRTTVEENAAAGRFIAERLNAMRGPVRFLLPEGGVSMLDAPGQPFHDPEADRVLFDTIEQHTLTGANRRVQRVGANINDPAFVDALVSALGEVDPQRLERN